MLTFHPSGNRRGDVRGGNLCARGSKMERQTGGRREVVRIRAPAPPPPCTEGRKRGHVSKGPQL